MSCLYTAESAQSVAFDAGLGVEVPYAERREETHQFQRRHVVVCGYITLVFFTVAPCEGR